MRVAITGGRGMLGRALAEEWTRQRPEVELVLLTRDLVDLRERAATRSVIADIAPDLVVHTAARVGGIAANVADPTGFLMDNLLIDSSVLDAAQSAGVRRLIYVGSSCMYPRDYRQPLVETDLLAAPLEPTNEGYALAKIVASKYCEYASTQLGLDWRTIVPSNLFGPGDDYRAGTSHLVAAAIAKTWAAAGSGEPSVAVWGDGTARREFTYAGDVAEWVVSVSDRLHDLPPMLNVGAGVDHSVLDIYRAAARVTGFAGEFRLQPDKPAGMQQKLMDSTAATEFGWAPRTSLEDGMRRALDDFRVSVPAA